MLIRWANSKDLSMWRVLAAELCTVIKPSTDIGTDTAFIDCATSRIGEFEALTAVDYMSGKNMGFIGFSRAENRILWLGVSSMYRRKGAGGRLLKTALRQLDTNQDITVAGFQDDEPGMALRAFFEKFGFAAAKPVVRDSRAHFEMNRPASSEKRGGSFHYRYPAFVKAANPEYCPVCNSEPAPDGQGDIACNDIVWVCGEYPGQGRLFGKIYVMPRKHYFHFEDIPETDAACFMREVQRTGRALRKVTGAEKINYEMHANSGAHLHIHLFPRYLDDEFPSAPIDYRICEPTPYESLAEYQWFIERMREELK